MWRRWGFMPSGKRWLLVVVFCALLVIGIAAGRLP